MSSDIASTLGWDTVFAVHIADLNEVIAARKASPAGFSATDPEDEISVIGKFGTWQIVPGGSGGLLWMNVPFRDTVLTMKGKAQPPRSGTATIQLRLRFLDQDAGAAAPGAPRALKLTVQTQAASSDEPAVTILDPPGIVYDGETPRFMEQTALETLLDIWMNSHLDEFQHVFATVDINAVAAHDGFQWLQPTHVDYVREISLKVRDRLPIHASRTLVNLYKLWNRLASGSYFPPPVRRVDIPKDDGRTRPLGIPTVADRIAQMVVKRYLEPLVEPHFHDDSYGYRPGKSALDAVGVAPWVRMTDFWQFCA